MGKIIEFLISCFAVLVIVFAPIVIMAWGASGVKLDFKKRFKNKRKKINARPTGKWTRVKRASYGGFEYSYYKCSNCGNLSVPSSDYCAKCGARMESEQ